ncbi:MAG TPA: DUF983 domain-containing protein [Opitutae bacterium]|nr:DUF983 domain-containing protein [Opitutae bacterium]
MKVERAEIITRSLTGRCPNCGHFGIFKHWFRLNKHCTHCAMPLEKEDSGFYFGTTSIGYVLAIIVVIIPICILVVQDVLEMWTGVIIGIVGSVLLTSLLYPLMLSWVIMSYYTMFPHELPLNAGQAPDATNSKD